MHLKHEANITGKRAAYSEGKLPGKLHGTGCNSEKQFKKIRR
jgi:hypothetical protein